MKYNARTLPLVNPMMVRSIRPLDFNFKPFGGVVMFINASYDVEDVGIVSDRLEYDEDVVDCSNRLFDITNQIIFQDYKKPKHFTVLPSRRWRNYRSGDTMTGFPYPPQMEAYKVEDRFKHCLTDRLLYIGNPIRIFFDPRHGITVVRNREFIIKSGVQLQSESTW